MVRSVVAARSAKRARLVHPCTREKSITGETPIARETPTTREQAHYKRKNNYKKKHPFQETKTSQENKKTVKEKSHYNRKLHHKSKAHYSINKNMIRENMSMETSNRAVGQKNLSGRARLTASGYYLKFQHWEPSSIIDKHQ